MRTTYSHTHTQQKAPKLNHTHTHTNMPIGCPKRDQPPKTHAKHYVYIYRHCTYTSLLAPQLLQSQSKQGAKILDRVAKKPSAQLAQASLGSRSKALAAACRAKVAHLATEHPRASGWSAGKVRRHSQSTGNLKTSKIGQ